MGISNNGHLVFFRTKNKLEQSFVDNGKNPGISIMLYDQIQPRKFDYKSGLGVKLSVDEFYLIKDFILIKRGKGKGIGLFHKANFNNVQTTKQFFFNKNEKDEEQFILTIKDNKNTSKSIYLSYNEVLQLLDFGTWFFNDYIIKKHFEFTSTFNKNKSIEQDDEVEETTNSEEDVW